MKRLPNDPKIQCFSNDEMTHVPRSEWPLWVAGSTGRRNTGVKSLCWGFELQDLTWPLV